jgi:hypothetical protein
MAQDRLEECMQAVAGRANSGTVERRRDAVNSVDQIPNLLPFEAELYDQRNLQ